MKLSVLERLIALNILPNEGSYTNLKLLREAKESLSFNEKENKDLAFTQDEGGLKWKADAVGDKEVEVGEVVTKLLSKELKKLNDEEKLTEEHVSLYSKFVEEK